MLQTVALRRPLTQPAALPAPSAKPSAAGPQDTVQLSSPTAAALATPNSPGRATDAPPKANWTILVYSAADNSLTDAMVQNLVDCQKVGSSNSVNIVSQLDVGGTAGCNRYYIKKSDSSTLDSPVVQKMGDVNMSDPKTLADFIAWGTKAYPSDHVMVIISDHGDGWRGAVEDDSAGGAFMSIPQIQQGLQMAQDQTGRTVDILGFDACLMANTEVAEQLKGNYQYMVASEETEGAAGWPYTRILTTSVLKGINQTLLMKANATAKDLAGGIVKDATGDQDTLPTLSAFDADQVGAMTAAEKTLADAVLASTTPVATLKQAANNAQKFDDTSDLYDFADRLASNATVDDKVKQAATALKAAITNAVFAEEHSAALYPNAHGVTVNLSTDSAPGSDYTGLAMPKQTGWDQMLAKLAGAPASGKPHVA